jgi:uncharacterized membrane protein
VVEFEQTVENVGKAMDLVGVAVIVGGAVLATAGAARRAARRDGDVTYRSYRHALGRSILLGLEVLVAADIIRTVAVEPDFTSVGVLALIVAVRTFLSLSLELEISGRWPWQGRPEGRTS